MTTTLYLSWRDVPKAKWRWANFSPAEIACRGSGSIKVNEDALDCLQALRDLLGKPMIVLSGYRSPEHNRRVGGARASKHMEGAAFDIAMANHDPAAFEAAARKAGFLGFRFLPSLGLLAYRSRPGPELGPAFPGPGDAICDRGSTGTGGAFGEPHAEGRWRGGRSHGSARRASRWPKG